MNIQQVLEQAINWPEPNVLAAAAGAAAVLLFAAGLIALSGRFRWVTRLLLLLGCLVIMAVLTALRLQTISERQSENIIATRPRYPEATRIRAGWGLVAVPSAVTFGVVVAWIARRQRLRAQVPRRLKLAHRYQVEGKYPEALAEYSRAIQILPHLGEAYCARGRVYATIGEHENAIADFDRAIDHDPRHSRSRVERARLRIEKGDIDGALEDLAIAFTMRANDPECHLLRGICLSGKGEEDEALADFHRVLKLTNHSDFADPARIAIQRLETGRGLLRGELHSANGTTDEPSQDLIKPQDTPL